MPQKILFLAGVNPIFKLGESQLDQNEHRREIGGERKSLLMSLLCMRVAHEKEIVHKKGARWTCLKDGHSKSARRMLSCFGYKERQKLPTGWNFKARF